MSRLALSGIFDERIFVHSVWKCLMGFFGFGLARTLITTS